MSVTMENVKKSGVSEAGGSAGLGTREGAVVTPRGGSRRVREGERETAGGHGRARPEEWQQARARALAGSCKSLGRGRGPACVGTLQELGSHRGSRV